MTYVLELLDKEIRNSCSKLSLLKKEAEPDFDSVWDKGFNIGSRMYLEKHISYLILLKQKLSNITNDDDDDV
jgi:hypothetical protein